jgi:translation initiation factor 2-alpha kinase 4
MDIMNQSKSSLSQKRAAVLIKKGLLRSTADEQEVFAKIEENIDRLLIVRLEKVFPFAIMRPAIEKVLTLHPHV